MEQMNCDIIRDLIPSYVDEVCSESTKRCVEEHLGSCGGCRQMLETYKGHSLSGQKLEQKELDSLKKIKNRMKFQNAVCYIILVFLLYCGFEVFFANHINYVIFSHPALLFVICILANLLFSIGYKCRTPLGKAEYLLGAVSFVLDLYFILLFLYFAARLRTATEISQTILGMAEDGPFSGAADHSRLCGTNPLLHLQPVVRHPAGQKLQLAALPEHDGDFPDHKL